MSVHSYDGLQTWSTKLKRIGVLSAANKDLVFNNIGHLVSADMLQGAFERLDGKKAVGVDKVTKECYGKNLRNNVDDLMRRIRRGSYRPQAARVIEIPKEDGSNRPLAISCVEDKLVQIAVAEILGTIYEPLFLPCSHGFRPNRGCHDALRALSQTAFQLQDGAVVEIDLRKYFNTIPHGPLMEFLAKKISDRRFLWLVKVLLQAPTIDESGVCTANSCGSPQGSIVSPILSNIFLHHVIDEWFEAISHDHFHCRAWEIRYADDMVFLFDNPTDAERFYRVLDKRLNKYGIEMHKEKSQMLPAGRRAAAREHAMGRRIPTFKFLGFTCYWGRSRLKKHIWRLKLKSRSDRMGVKLKGLREFLRKHLNTPNTRATIFQVVRVIRGWVNYHAVSDNHRAVTSFLVTSARILFRWYNRRGGKVIYWNRFQRVLKAHRYPRRPRLLSLFNTPNRAYA